MGPMTGRGAGFCTGYPAPGFANAGWGGGYGWGRGFGGGRGRGGWGRRNVYYATGLTGWQRAGGVHPAAFGAAPAWGGNVNPYAPGYAPEQELNALKSQAEYLEDALEGIRTRMAELDKEPQGQAKDTK